MTKEQIDAPIQGYPDARRRSEVFYSNCMLQAVLHKIRHPIKTKLIYVPASIQDCGVPHFFWCDDTGDYDFASDGYISRAGAETFHRWELLRFRGFVRQHKKGFAARYKQQQESKRRPIYDQGKAESL